MSIESIWNYYKEVADKETKWNDPENKTGADPLSLTFFFSKNSTAAGQNELVRAFLKDPSLNWRNAPVDNISADDIMSDVSKVTPPYKAQMTAICNALNYPFSIVHGPPGTGKTEMILNLLAVIHRKYPQKTAAIVSSNMEAVKNIYDKIKEAASAENSDPVLEELYSHIAVLGSKGRRREWFEIMEERGLDADGLFDGDKFSPELLGQFKFFTTTIHSLRKIFKKSEDFNDQFDFVIMDEASQTKIMLGIIAMSCAKQMAVIGDDKQLAPIIKETEIAVGEQEEYNSVNEIYKEAEEKSFLSVCESVFGDNAKSTLLNEHYRCLPSIIGFCNKYVYDNALAVKTREEGFHIRAVWYDGDYCEKITVKNDRKIYNMKQINIFVKEELPRISRLMQRNESLSVMVIAPFREQIERLRNALEEEAFPYDENDGGDDNEALARSKIYSLTIHKAQGKGFDVVYMLTTEDYKTDREAPWCQRMRMMNVAVSRAKKEFCIIASSQWLPKEIRKASANYVSTDPPYDLSDPNNMFFCKLLEYVKDKCPEPVGDHGFHKSKIKSVFDRTPYYRRKYHTGNDRSFSAPARLVFEMLENIAGEYPKGDNYCVLREVPLNWFELRGSAVSCNDAKLTEFAEKAAADFVVCRGGQVRLILEVDGGYHRTQDEKQEKCDSNKDLWIKEVLGSDSIYLRLSTDGTSENEEAAVKEIINNSADSRLKIDLKKIKGKRSFMIKEDVLDKLNERIQEAFVGLKSAIENEIAKTDGVTDDFEDAENRRRLANMEIFKALATKNNFSDAQNASYTEKLLTDYYLCRYAKAYVFEYAMIYDIVMRSFIKNGGNDQLGVFSFGCGSFTDALSMLYSKACLCGEDECYENCKLYYKGIDVTQWNGAPFVYPQFIDYTEIQCPTDLDEKLCREYEKIYFFRKDINKFIDENIIAGCGNAYHNVLFFPKILNELPDEAIDIFCGKLKRIRFTHNEYYICVSHSPYHFCNGDGAGANAADKIIAAINRNNEFEVCSDLREMLGDDEWEKFKTKWLKNDRLVDTPTPKRHSCYSFEVRINENDEEIYTYIDNLNADFGFNREIRDYLAYNLKALLKSIEPNTRVDPVVRVSQIRFQIIRLKRRSSV